MAREKISAKMRNFSTSGIKLGARDPPLLRATQLVAALVPRYTRRTVP